MNQSDKIHIIVAETSPIIAMGIVQVINSMPGHQVFASEVSQPAHLQDALKAEHCEILVVNPLFGGSFNPEAVRAMRSDIKIMAIEVGRLSRPASNLFDDTISIIDDDAETIACKIDKLGFGNEAAKDENKEQLSQREKEITALVVKGLTNKEIADALFISVHTVITHRRNIARKLEIHSATGLTIYAIMNNIVDLAELKLRES